jgi:bifunctional non-homologous end joining protein LigD
MPAFIPPMKAEAVDVLPRNQKNERIWGYEPKIDGHRLQILKNGNRVRIRTRNDRQPVIDVRTIMTQAAQVAADQAIIDGEGAAVDDSGRIRWDALDRRDARIPVVFFAFDLLYLNGRSLLAEPLSLRQRLLADIIEGSGLQLCTALPGTLAEITRVVKRMGLEGLVAKDQRSAYRPDRRTLEWQKKRFNLQQEFAIGGYRPNGNDRVDSLVVGVYEGSQLKFSSKVRAGLDKTNRGLLRRALQPHTVARCPFADLPNAQRRGKTSWDSGGVSAEEMDEIHWVRPRLLAEVKFLHWTDSGRLRHPWFVRLRSDKPAKDVVRET